ncbi:MAG: cyclophilin-like fold protein [Candidatus Bathyarchaeia archaeon]
MYVWDSTMPGTIKIHTKSTGYVQAEVSTERNPETAEAILGVLPIRSRVNRWGDEIYFTIPLRVEEENPQQEVEVGDLGYWPPGNAFCIFFGRTPASTGERPRAASPVNVFGRVLGDSTVFREARSGEEIRVEKV